jgi:predicted dienelactone hydrolase
LVLFFKQELLPVLLCALVSSGPVSAREVDTPALAGPGKFAAGVTTLELGARHLSIRVWYPARAGGATVTYRATMAGPDEKKVALSIAGTAVADAAPVAGRFPLVVLAHGYGNNAEVMAWLGENLATKGYVVAAPTFGDPAGFDTAKLGEVIAHRPLDIAFVAAEAARRARAGQAPFAHADAGRVALIGYSMGGYGVLTAAGAALEPALGQATAGMLAPYVAGAAQASALQVADVRAVVAISPPFRLGQLTMWSPAGLAGIHVPTFLVGGSQDHIVGYDPGIRTIFGSETKAPRYLLTFLEAGHNIGLSGAPAEMQSRLWDKDWFEDPVWRKSRLMGIEAHFITAFLDRYVKDDTAKAAYIDGLVPHSDDGTWADAPPPYDAVSPGPPAATLWKGFQPAHAAGMTLEFRPPAMPPPAPARAQ